MRFNFLRGTKNETLNYEGAKAFTLTPQLELYTAVATAALSDNFYENADARLKRLQELVAKNDAVFTAKLAVYAREQMYLRSVPLVLAVELAKQHNGDGLVAALTERVVQRADEIAELLSYYALSNARTNVKQLNRLSKQLQKGLAAAFNKFDEYQFAKYNRDANVTLKDALFLVHPKAKDKNQQELFDKIVNDTLQTPYTWETALSALGQQLYDTAALKQEAVKDKWEELIASNKLGYMALLRNLRNILEAGVNADMLNKACSYLANEKAVANSKQLPFRFLAAYRELAMVQNGHVSRVMDALEKAVFQSAANIEGFNNNTSVLIAVDMSGSMQVPVSAKSTMQRYEVGLILAMLLQSRCANVITGIFGQTYRQVQLPHTNILSNTNQLAKMIGDVGHSTNGYLVIADLLNRKKVVDKVMLFTDMQLWNDNSTTSIAELWKQYKKFAIHAKLYLFDLAGYGNTPLNVLRDDVYLISGWSDKIFAVLSAVEKGSNAVEMIEAVQL
ncbi:MAG TPA: TROVE domain-containing protein [Chitinophagaceae bacterium]|nr:TROVE domain-containing protein [Chitinophagaceae bacterium]